MACALLATYPDTYAGGSIIGLFWFALAMLRQKSTGEKAPAGLKAETPEGQPAELGVGVHVPFGPMISIAGVLHFLWLHRWVDVLVEQARFVFLVQG